MTYHLDDLTPGMTFGTPSYRVTAEDIKAFAAQWDPQPFHLDEVAAEDSFFEGLAASGWHTAAATMRLLVTGEMKLPLGVIGAGVESIKWHRPVRPGEVLTATAKVVEIREMRSRPGLGLVKLEVVTAAGADPVQTMVTSVLVPKRR